jgi:hypothetical protein
MYSGFFVYNEDTNMVLGKKRGPRVDLPIVEAGSDSHSNFTRAKAAYKSLFDADIPNHLISVNDKDVEQGVYLVRVRSDSAKALPDSWCSVSSGLSPLNPNQPLFHLLALAMNLVVPDVVLDKDSVTVILPKLLANLPYDLGAIQCLRDYSIVAIEEGRLFLRMYRGAIPTWKEALGDPHGKKGKSLFWNLDPFRLFVNPYGMMIEVSPEVNPYKVVGMYKDLLENLHGKLDALGIARPMTEV